MGGAGGGGGVNKQDLVLTDTEFNSVSVFTDGAKLELIQHEGLVSAGSDLPGSLMVSWRPSAPPVLPPPSPPSAGK